MTFLKRFISRVQAIFTFPRKNQSRELLERKYRADLCVALRRQLLSRRAVSTSIRAKAYDAQFIFCMDVREERLRHEIEVAGSYETWSGPGIFGIPRRCIVTRSAIKNLENILLEDRVAYAENMLRSIGLTGSFAPLVVLCGHRGREGDHEESSFLDCGACGGRPGGVNAEMMACILNEQSVRNALAVRDIVIPATTSFIGAEHNTTTHEIMFFQPETLDAAHQALLESVRNIVTSAERRACSIDKAPQWGLARNSAFIIAPRSLTKAIDLDNRVFLHSYEWESDREGTLLGALLSGPVMIAQSINQYYLTLKDDSQGAQPPFIPLRLFVAIRAPRELVFSLVQQQSDLIKLVVSEAIALCALDPRDSELSFLATDLTWEKE